MLWEYLKVSHRAHGSTGNSQDPGRTWKGKKMAGQYGNVRKTIQNLTVVKLIDDDNLILVEGAVPGSKNGIVIMRDSIKCKLPENAPFPAGLNIKTQPKESETVLDDVNSNVGVKSDDKGGDVER